MNQMEKSLLILKAKFSDNEEIKNQIDAIIQLKRPEILLDNEEQRKFHEYATDWYNKGLIIYSKSSVDEDD